MSYPLRVIAAIALLALVAVGVAAWVVDKEPDWYLRARYPLEYEHILRAHGESRGLDPALLAAVVYVESRFDPNAESEAGALGLMQLLPETARGIALRTGGDRFLVADLRDPELNVRYGSWYLRNLLDRFGTVEFALAAYHAGQGNVDDWRRRGAGIAFPETRDYIRRVTELERVYRRIYAARLGLS